MYELVDKSYELGYNACPNLSSSPAMNFEFLKILPDHDFNDEVGIQLRIKMYKAYIKGWSQAHLDKVWNVN